jgi:hypothetical protein
VAIPGEAFAVMRGRLPRVDGVARLVCCAERPMIMPEEVRKLTTDPGGRVGCDLAVLAAPAGTPPTGPEGELRDGTRLNVQGRARGASRARHLAGQRASSAPAGGRRSALGVQELAYSAGNSFGLALEPAVREA